MPTDAVIEPTRAALDGRPDYFDRSHAMYLLLADLARAHRDQRLREASEHRLVARACSLRRADRMLRRAERAHLRARRALAQAVMQ